MGFRKDRWVKRVHPGRDGVVTFMCVGLLLCFDGLLRWDSSASGVGLL